MAIPFLAALGRAVTGAMARSGPKAKLGTGKTGASRGATTEAERVRQQVDEFDGLFKDNNKHAHHGVPGGGGNSGGGGGGGEGGGDGGEWGKPTNSPGEHIKGQIGEQVAKFAQAKLQGLLEKAFKIASDPVGAFAEKFEHVTQNLENSVNNKFMPMLIDKLPGGFGKLVSATHSLIETFINRGKELSSYNGQLAVANAMANARSTMADIREARELGPGTAKLTTASSDIWIEIRDMMLPMKKAVVENLANAVQGISDLIAIANKLGLSKVVEEQIKMTNAVVKGSTWQLQVGMAILEKLSQRNPEDLQKIADNMMDHDYGDDEGNDFHGGNHRGDVRVPNMPMGIPALA